MRAHARTHAHCARTHARTDSHRHLEMGYVHGASAHVGRREPGRRVARRSAKASQHALQVLRGMCMASPETLLVANAAREHRIASAPRKPLMRGGMDLFALLWRQPVIASIHRIIWRMLSCPLLHADADTHTRATPHATLSRICPHTHTHALTRARTHARTHAHATEEMGRANINQGHAGPPKNGRRR